MPSLRRTARIAIPAACLLLPSIAQANSSSPTIVVWSRAGVNTPFYSTWSGSAWGSASALPSVGAVAKWITLRNCPTRNEIACGSLDAASDVNITFYNGSAWSAVTEMSADTGSADDRCFSMAYEQQSGDLLLVYWNDSPGAKKLAWRTYNGTSLSAQSLLTMPTTHRERFISATPNPGSDEIIVLAMNDHNDLYAVVWNGTSFGAVSTLESDAQTDGNECFATTYESVSHRALVAYAEKDQANPRFRTWNGTTWSAEAQLPSIGRGAYWIRLVPDPSSNQILFAALDTDSDINVNAWDGTTWGTNLEIETNCAHIDRREFDVAYERGGAEALIAYEDNATNSIRYRTWNGSAWSAEQTGPDLGAAGQVIQLRTGVNTGEIMFAAADSNLDLKSAKWSDTSMGSLTTLETSLGGINANEQFMMSVTPPAPLVPANIPYATTFESGADAEWGPTTTSTNGTLTTYAGRHRRDLLKLALNTTIGETYSLTFDLYTIDSWDGSTGANGPDYFNVSVDGTQTFRQSFVHDAASIANGATYPYSADQYGAYGYSAATDGIFRTVQVVFTASASTTTLGFYASLTDPSDLGYSDESWGIDNVSVARARFLDVSSARGFNLITTTTAADGSALHWGDLDNDGDLDAILTGGASSRLMLNNGPGGSYAFTGSVFGGGAVREQGALADFDNDGDLDFWSCEVAADGVQRLFENNGAAAFSNAGDRGFTGPGINEGCAASDVNADGWCDLVVFSDNGNWVGQNQAVAPLNLVGTMAASYGLNGAGSYGARGFCASVDVNNDGMLDFFYRYNNGRLFISTAASTYTQNAHGISVLTGGTEDTAAAWGDYDNDGDLDLFVPRTTAGYSGTLWRNDVNWTTGVGNFTDVTAAAGLALNGQPAYASNPGTRSGCWGDYDNDGDLDLYIVGANGNGLLYQNQGNGTFKRVGEGLNVTGSAHDAVFVDYDNDGDLDLAVTRQSATSMLYENRTNSTGYLKVRLIGLGDRRTNKAAIGTRVELWNAGGTQLLARRDIGVARGYGGTQPLWAHFGGVTNSTSYKLKVYWRSRPVANPQVIDVVPVTTSSTIGAQTIPQMITVTEPETTHVIRWNEVRNKAP